MRLAFGYDVATDRLLEIADSAWTSPDTDDEKFVDRMRWHTDSYGARDVVFALDAIKMAKNGPSLRGQASRGNDWPAYYGGHPNDMWNSPRDTYEARLRAAYWLAVCARYGYPTLLTKADDYVTFVRNGVTSFFTSSAPGYSKNAVEIGKIYEDAAAAIKAVAPNDKRFVDILALFGAQADPESIANITDIKEEGTYMTFFTSAGNDITNLVYYLRGLVTGEKPPGMTDREWWWKKWGTRMTIGAIGVGALLLIGRPYVMLAADALKSVKGSTQPTKANRRRRRSSRRSKK